MVGEQQETQFEEKALPFACDYCSFFFSSIFLTPWDGKDRSPIHRLLSLRLLSFHGAFIARVKKKIACFIA